MADPAPAPDATQAPATPDFNQKQYVEYNKGIENYLSAFNDLKNSNLSLRYLSEMAHTKDGGPNASGINNYQMDVARSLIQKNSGLADVTLSQLNADKGNVDFATKYDLGKTYSLNDYVKRYSASNPNFDPKDAASVNSVAQALSDRGLDPLKNKEDVQNFVANYSVKSNVDKALNPQNYITPEQQAANQATATRLVQQTFPGQAADPDMVDFLSKHLAAGETPFEISQFLQTTPQYLKAQNDAQAAQQNQSALDARNALDQNLQQTQQQVFERATPNIIASYMKAGRLGSSGLNSALAQAQQQLDQQRQSFLGQQAYQQAVGQQGYNQQNYVNQQGQAFNQYLRQNQPAYQQQLDAAGANSFANFQQPYNYLNRQFNLNDQATQRQYQLQDYQMQQNDFNNYLQQQRKGASQAALYGLLGSAIGGAAQGFAMR